MNMKEFFWTYGLTLLAVLIVIGVLALNIHEFKVIPDESLEHTEKENQRYFFLGGVVGCEKLFSDLSENLPAMSVAKNLTLGACVMKVEEIMESEFIWQSIALIVKNDEVWEEGKK